VLDSLNDALAPHIFPDKGDGTDPRACPVCGDGRLSLKTSRFGAFVGCSNYPECRFTRAVGAPDAEGSAESGERELGTDPDTGEAVSLKIGRFGPYVQLGQGEKPKRSSLPKGWTPESLDLERALKLLSLPREVGLHPEDGQPITAGLGRYGPFVAHAGAYANLDGIEEVFEVGLNRAVALLAEKRAGGKGRGRAEPQALKDLGAHPQTGEPVKVLSGRYGPYVKSGAVNATLPRGADPQAFTLEQAVALIAEKAGKTPAKGRGRAAAKPAAKAAPKAKKAAAPKKTAAKKATVDA
jgi:DNA topoisomerase-1